MPIKERGDTPEEPTSGLDAESQAAWDNIPDHIKKRATEHSEILALLLKAYDDAVSTGDQKKLKTFINMIKDVAERGQVDLIISLLGSGIIALHTLNRPDSGDDH